MEILSAEVFCCVVKTHTKDLFWHTDKVDPDKTAQYCLLQSRFKEPTYGAQRTPFSHDKQPNS